MKKCSLPGQSDEASASEEIVESACMAISVVDVSRNDTVPTVTLGASDVVPIVIKGEKVSEVREVDGYVDATHMCFSYGKPWSQFRAGTAASTFIKALVEATGIPEYELIVYNEKQKAGDRRTWVYPALAVKLVSWCGAEYSEAYMQTVFEMKIRQHATSSNGRDADNAVALVAEVAAVVVEGVTAIVPVAVVQSSEVSNPIARTFEITEVTTGYMLNGTKIRKTDETPPRISVYDIMCAITGHSMKHASTELNRLLERHPEVPAGCGTFKFPGQGQRPTPVTNARGLVMIMQLLPGPNAAQFLMKAADVMVRYLGGDQSLIEASGNPSIDELNVVCQTPVSDMLDSDIVATSGASTSGQSFVEALMGDDGQMITEMRHSDGFINATKMCKSAGRKWADFAKNDTTKVFLDVLRTELGKREEVEKSKVRILTLELIVIRHGGDHSGTWVHPRVAIKLAAWCSAKFEVKVTDIILRNATGKIDEPVAAVAPVASVVDVAAVEPVTAIVPVAVVHSSEVSNLGRTFEITEVENGYMLNGVKIRKTTSIPPKISVYDLISAITGQPGQHGYVQYRRLVASFPEVLTECWDFKFPGQGQRPTPVTDARGLMMIMTLLPGPQAAQFRMKAADVMVRYLGGDQSLIEEIQRNAAAQEALPDSNIATVFGDAVASTSREVKAAARLVVVSKTLLAAADFRCLGVPSFALPPNATYLIFIGTDGIYNYWKFGISADYDERKSAHSKSFEVCVTQFVVSCGEHSAAPLEATIRNHVRHMKVVVKDSQGHHHGECFRTPVEEKDAVVFALLDKLRGEHGRKINDEAVADQAVRTALSTAGSAQVEKEKTQKAEFATKERFNGPEGAVPPWLAECLAVEESKERQNQAMILIEQEKTKQEQEKTKQFNAEMELVKLKIELRKLEK